MLNITSTSLVDRPPVTESIKDAIRTVFAAVPEGKTNALLAIYDLEAKRARLNYAWKVNNTWKVGAQVGWTLHEKPTGFVGIEAAW